MEIKAIAVIGAGQMGSGIAQVGMMSGFSVKMMDIKEEFLDRGRDNIIKSLRKLQEKGETIGGTGTFCNESPCLLYKDSGP